jgi:hypothetical protein
MAKRSRDKRRENADANESFADARVVNRRPSISPNLDSRLQGGKAGGLVP